jgi:hypothetical protein
LLGINPAREFDPENQEECVKKNQKEKHNNSRCPHEKKGHSFEDDITYIVVDSAMTQACHRNPNPNPNPCAKMKPTFLQGSTATKIRTDSQVGQCGQQS